MAGVDITKLGTSEIENAQQTAVELGIYDIVQEKVKSAALFVHMKTFID